MADRAKDFLNSSKKQSDRTNNKRGKNTTDAALTNTGKPIAVWQSPEFEEFDLCMEVTAYVQHWD